MSSEKTVKGSVMKGLSFQFREVAIFRTVVSATTVFIHWYLVNKSYKLQIFAVPPPPRKPASSMFPHWHRASLRVGGGGKCKV